MRIKKSACSWLLLGVTSLSGCSVYDKIIHNAIIDPAHYDRYSDKLGRCVRDKCLAEEAWDEICARDGDVYSRHYYRGFMDGFTDYLDAGGSGDPPPLPPRSYWRLYYQTPEGHEAIQDWFSGFRHGADVARASGVRDLVTVPVSSVPPKEVLLDTSQAATEARQENPPGADRPLSLPPPTPKGEEKLPQPNPAEGPVLPKTANGKPMPPPTPPIIPVERMIAPPIPKTTPPPR
jgi:hypothetical protein